MPFAVAAAALSPPDVSDMFRSLGIPLPVEGNPEGLLTTPAPAVAALVGVSDSAATTAGASLLAPSAGLCVVMLGEAENCDAVR